MKRVCVFCGSSPGGRPEYVEAARTLGRALARRGLGLVYGGAKVGVMGAVARAVLEEGGRVTGVIPKHLVREEVAFTGLDDLRVVGSMHERKALMAELAGGFVALPGGLGTIEEFFEVLTWAQLGLHRKPCGLLNVCGYYTPLVHFVDHAVEQAFIDPRNRSLILLEDEPEALLDRLTAYEAPQIDKAAWALRLAGGQGQA